MNTVKENLDWLLLFHQSMNTALKKAQYGSNAEDGYYLEKLEKAANIMGFDLVKQK